MHPHVAIGMKVVSPVLAALVAVAIYRHWVEPERVAPAIAPTVEEEQAVPDEQRFQQPARPVRPARARRPEPNEETDQADPPEPDAPAGREPADREAAARKERDEHAEKVAAHHQEPRDARWARGMEQAITVTFDEAKEVTGGAVESIDCRSVTCAVELRWPSQATARAHLLQTVQIVGPGMECQRQLTLPESDSGEEEVSATLLLDCTEQRSPQEQ
jgi:hypothetical protein